MVEGETDVAWVGKLALVPPPTARYKRPCNNRANHNICITYILYVCLPLLVSRCNGTYYLEVNVIYPCKSPHWAVEECPKGLEAKEGDNKKGGSLPVYLFDKTRP
jgi:hypothetical protein